MPPIRISFSMFCADFKNLGAVINSLEMARVEELHFDVVDGHFARIISIGPQVVASLRDATLLPFETHLAVSDPDLFLEDVAWSGSNTVTTQIEACPNAFRFVRRARELGLRVGFALNPATPLNMIENLLEEIDVAQVQQTIPAVVGAGANVLVLGTSCGILKDLSRAPARIEEIRALAHNATGQPSPRSH